MFSVFQRPFLILILLLAFYLQGGPKWKCLTEFWGRRLGTRFLTKTGSPTKFCWHCFGPKFLGHPVYSCLPSKFLPPQRCSEADWGKKETPLIICLLHLHPFHFPDWYYPTFKVAGSFFQNKTHLFMIIRCDAFSWKVLPRIAQHSGKAQLT